MRLWTAILAGLQILSGGAFLGDLIGAKGFGAFVLLVAALQGDTVAYMRNPQDSYQAKHAEPESEEL